MGTLGEIVAQYGAAVIFVGTFLEGETIVVIGGVLAHQGILSPAVVAAAAFLGSFLGDQFWFYLGRRHASYRLIARVTRRPVFAKVLSAIEDHPVKFILSFRFIYGIRTVSPVAIGMTDVAARKFLLLNAISAAVWAIAFTALGYVSGQAVTTLLGDIKAIEHRIFAMAAGALAVFVAFQIGWRAHRRFLAGRASPKSERDDEAS